MDDRALRRIVVGLGGRANGLPRETGFDITAASEVMAILAVSRSYKDLRARLGAITVGANVEGSRVTAEQLGAAGAMAAVVLGLAAPWVVEAVLGAASYAIVLAAFERVVHPDDARLFISALPESRFRADRTTA